MKEILLIAPLAGYKYRPDKLDHFFLEYLVKNSKYKIHLSEADDNNISKILENKNDMIVIAFTLTPNLKKYSNTKIYWIYDFCCTCFDGCDGRGISGKKICGFKEQEDYIKNNNFDYVWYKYFTYITKKLSIQNPNKYFKFPHMMFDPEKHKDYNLEKKYDILFYGATYPKSYPFRNRLYHFLVNNSKKFRVHFLPYSKRKPKKMTTGVELNKLISQSWLTVSTCLTVNILVAKYFEIGLCGSVICGDYPQIEDETFLKKNMIYINKHMSDDQMLKIITDALNNKELLKEYSKNTKEYLSKNYMMKNGVDRFDNLISKIDQK
jgi:hypothetical protein